MNSANRRPVTRPAIAELNAPTAVRSSDLLYGFVNMKQNFECTGCKTPLAGHELYQTGPFQPGYCSKCWSEVMGKEIACPNCYGGHFRPCQWCGDTGRVTSVPHPYNEKGQR